MHVIANDVLHTAQNRLIELSTECESRERDVEAYQQTVKQREQEIASLKRQLEEQEAVIKQASSQPSVPALDLDKSVMEVVQLRTQLSETEEEKQKALRLAKAMEQEITKIKQVRILPFLCLRGFYLEFWHP